MQDTARINLHTHTVCSDGRMSPEEVIQAGVAAGLSHIGIADHFVSTKLLPGRGVTAYGLDPYLAEVRELAEEYARKIRVLAGIEIDFCPERTDFGLLTATGRRPPFDALDFILFEYVNDPEWRGEDLATLMGMRDCFACPIGFAHNNVARNFAAWPPEELVRALEETDIFVELCCAEDRNLVARYPGDAPPNALYELTDARRHLAELQCAREESGASPVLEHEMAELRRELAVLEQSVEPVPYYRAEVPFNDEFYRLVRSSGVLLSIGTDAHISPEQVGAVDDAATFVRERGLEDRLITRHLWT